MKQLFLSIALITLINPSSLKAQHITIGDSVLGTTPNNAIPYVQPAIGYNKLGVSATFTYIPGTTFPTATPDIIQFGGNNIEAAGTTGNTARFPSKTGVLAMDEDIPVYGQATLSSTNVYTVLDSRVKTGSIIVITQIGTPSVAKFYSVDNIVDGVSFDIRSSTIISATFNYIIANHY